MGKRFEGVYAVAVTPFNEDGTFNFEGAKNNLDWLINNGVHGICILGATGEYLSVSNDEHKEYIKEIVPYICERTSVIVGATRERPEEVVDLISNAKKYGAHAAMVLPPYYCHPTQEEIFSHFKFIMDNVDLPIAIYNNPGSAKVEIEAATFKKLFSLKNSMIVKESSGDIRKLTEVMLEAPETTSVFCGGDNIGYESFILGADGWVCMLANIAPKDCVEMYNCIHVEKNFEKGFEIYKKLLPSLNLLETFPKPVQTLKYFLNLRGLTGGFVRLPRLPLTNEEIDYINSVDKINEIR